MDRRESATPLSPGKPVFYEGYRRHARAEIAIFFAAGFLFNILTLLVQHELYLVMLASRALPSRELPQVVLQG